MNQKFCAQTVDSERRRNRSSNPEIALKLQLDQILKDFDFETCVLVDENGNLVAAPNNSHLERDEQLAQCSVQLASGTALAPEVIREVCRLTPAFEHANLVVQKFHTNGKPMMIAALARKQNTLTELGLYRTIFGVRRIQREALAQAA